MRSPIGSGATTGAGATSAAGCTVGIGVWTDGAAVLAEVGAGLVRVRLVSTAELGWPDFALVAVTPTSRRANANAAHITGSPIGLPPPPDVDCAPDPSIHNPTITLLSDCAAGAGAGVVTTGGGVDTKVDTDTDGAGADATTPVELPDGSPADCVTRSGAGAEASDVEPPRSSPALAGPGLPAAVSEAAPPRCLFDRPDRPVDAPPESCSPATPEELPELDDGGVAAPEPEGVLGAPALPVPPVGSDGVGCVLSEADPLDGGSPSDDGAPCEEPDVSDEPLVVGFDGGAPFACGERVAAGPVVSDGVAGRSATDGGRSRPSLCAVASSAKATAGLQAIAEPMPSATAKAPIRPMYAAQLAIGGPSEEARARMSHDCQFATVTVDTKVIT